MARIRSIHPGLFTDDAVMSASPVARWLFIGLLTECDDNGAFQWRPMSLKARILPADNVDIDALMGELEALNFIRSYELDGVKLGLVRNFTRYQRPKKPNSVHFIPPEYRTYVGLKVESTELTPDKEAPVPHQFPTSGEKVPQREEGGGRRLDGGGKVASATSRAAQSDFEKICEALGGFERVRTWENLRAIAANWLADFDLNLDVLPTIREVLAKKNGTLPQGASYFTPAIREAKERRISGKIQGRNGQATAPPIVEIGVWRSRAMVWNQHRKWSPEWGPDPTQTGCQLPPELLTISTSNPH